MSSSEPISSAEAIGRAIGLVLGRVSHRIEHGDGLFPSGDDLTNMGEEFALGGADVRPDIRDFFAGFLEGLSVCLDGDRSAGL